jgi:regulator of sirC expression with transglutaminase-like and TPR domain
MNPGHAMPVAALLLAAAFGIWLLVADPRIEPAAADAPLPLPPMPPRIATGLEYERCLGLLATEPETAATIARAWAARDGGEAAAHCLALSRIALGEPGPAAGDLERLAAASLSPSATRAALLDQATQAWLMAAQPARALESAAQAMALVPDDAALLIAHATAAIMLDRHAEAADDFTRALRLDPRRPDALVRRAAALRHLDRIAAALADAESALALDPANPEALLERGILRQRSGDDEGARADWEHVVVLAPDTPAADLARQNLALLEAGPSR